MLNNIQSMHGSCVSSLFLAFITQSFVKVLVIMIIACDYFKDYNFRAVSHVLCYSLVGH